MSEAGDTNGAEAARGVGRLAATLRGGWRPTLGWALTPCLLYAFIVGPLVRRPADAAQLAALFAAVGALVAARSFEKSRGVA